MLTACRNPVLRSSHDEDGHEDGVKGGKVILEICEPIISVNNLQAFSSGSSIHFFFFNDGTTLIHGEMYKSFEFWSFIMCLVWPSLVYLTDPSSRDPGLHFGALFSDVFLHLNTSRIF